MSQQSFRMIWFHSFISFIVVCAVRAHGFDLSVGARTTAHTHTHSHKHSLAFIHFVRATIAMNTMATSPPLVKGNDLSSARILFVDFFSHSFAWGVCVWIKRMRGRAHICSRADSGFVDDVVFIDCNYNYSCHFLFSSYFQCENVNGKINFHKWQPALNIVCEFVSSVCVCRACVRESWMHEFLCVCSFFHSARHSFSTLLQCFLPDKRQKKTTTASNSSTTWKNGKISLSSAASWQCWLRIRRRQWRNDEHDEHCVHAVSRSIFAKIAIFIKSRRHVQICTYTRR